MSTEVAKDFLLFIDDQPDLQSISITITDPNKLVELGKSRGYEFTVVNLYTAIKELIARDESDRGVNDKVISGGLFKDRGVPSVATEPQLIGLKYLSEEIKNLVKA